MITSSSNFTPGNRAGKAIQFSCDNEKRILNRTSFSIWLFLLSMDKLLIKNLDLLAGQWARAGASPARTLRRFDTRPENAFCRGAPGQGQAQPVPCYETIRDIANGSSHAPPWAGA